MSRGYTTGVRGGAQARSETPDTPSPAKGLGKLYRSEADPILKKMESKKLVDAEAAMSDQPLEHAAVYKDGKQILLKGSGLSNMVDFTGDNKALKAMKGAIFTHNHPLYDGVPLPFSRADVLMMRDYRMEEMRAVAGNVVFSIKPPKDSPFWKTQFKPIIEFMDKSLSLELRSKGVPGKNTDEMLRNAGAKQMQESLLGMMTGLNKKFGINFTVNKR
jgi:hypothetical protein